MKKVENFLNSKKGKVISWAIILLVLLLALLAIWFLKLRPASPNPPDENVIPGEIIEPSGEIVEEPIVPEKLSSGDYQIDTSSRTISFRDDLTIAEFVFSDNPDGPNEDDIWHEIGEIKQVEVENDEIEKKFVYYKAGGSYTVNGSTYTTLLAAYNAITGKTGTITATSNVVDKSVVEIASNKTITLVINSGVEIAKVGEDSGSSIQETTITNKGTLIIKGAGTIRTANRTASAKKVYQLITNEGTLTIGESGATGPTINHQGIDEVNRSCRAIENTKNVTINSGTVMIDDGYGIHDEGTGNIIVNGGKVMSTSDKPHSEQEYHNPAIHKEGSGKVEVKGGTIHGKKSAINVDDGVNLTVEGTTRIESENGSALYHHGSGDVTVKSASVSIQAAGGAAIRNDGSGTITVSAGTLTTVPNEEANLTGGSCGIDSGGTGDVIISGGSITGKTCGILFGSGSSGALSISGSPTIVGLGNTPDATNTKRHTGITTEGTNKISISGGTITGKSHGILTASGKNDAVSITGGTITAQGGSALYHQGKGAVTISGTTTATKLYSTGNATINNANTGTITVKGGTIVNTNSAHAAVSNTSGTIVIGENGGTPDTAVPDLRGAYGVSSSNGFSFYDGILRGTSGGHTGGTVTTQQYYVVTDQGSKTVDGKTYGYNEILQHPKPAGSVKITGTNTWGQTLTASVTNTNSATLSYQWYYSSSSATSGGTSISNATSSTYTIDKSLVGKYIYVIVTASKTNYTTTTWADVTDASNNGTAPVAKQALSVTATVYNAAYNGSAHGATIKVNSSAWNGKTIVSGTTNSYGSTATSNGAYNINYTLLPTYTNVTNQTTIYYKVTGGDYYNDATGTTSVTISSATLNGSVAITGTNTWGQTLTANVTNTNSATLSYQWYSNSTNAKTGGSAISGATSSTYTIDKSLVGKYIYVVVSASKANYTNTKWDDITDTSNTTATVAKQDLSVTPTAYNAVYNGNAHGAKIRVTSTEWDGKTIVSGISNSYDNTVTNAGEKDTDYELKPTYTDFTNGAKTIYYKVTGGSYYKDATGSTTVTITRANATIIPSQTSLTVVNYKTESITYTYNGDGAVSASSSNTNIFTVSHDASGKKVTITKKGDGIATLTISAAQGTNYNATSVTVSVEWKTVLPKITNMLLNAGATSTKNSDVVVELTIETPTGVDKMYLSENSTEPTESQWVDFAKYSIFRLSEGNTQKRVYAWVRDITGNVSAVVNKTITLNMTYTLTVTCNQTYSADRTYQVTYFLKEQGGTYPTTGQQSNIFTGLIPGKTYMVKTKLAETAGFSKESEEYTFKAVYNGTTNGIDIQ